MKYNQKELEGMLLNIGTVSSFRWDTILRILKYKDSLKVLEKQWENKYHPLDLTKVETWSTYDGECIWLDFFINVDGELLCNATIFNGDSFDGARKEKKFTAQILLPNEFISELHDNILGKFGKFLDNAYEDHLLAQKREWINDLKKQFIEQFNKP